MLHREGHSGQARQRCAAAGTPATFCGALIISRACRACVAPGTAGRAARICRARAPRAALAPSPAASGACRRRGAAAPRLAPSQTGHLGQRTAWKQGGVHAAVRLAGTAAGHHQAYRTASKQRHMHPPPNSAAGAVQCTGELRVVAGCHAGCQLLWTAHLWEFRNMPRSSARRRMCRRNVLLPTQPAGKMQAGWTRALAGATSEAGATSAGCG